MEYFVRPLLSFVAQFKHRCVRRPLQMKLAVSRDNRLERCDGDLQAQVATKYDFIGFQQRLAGNSLAARSYCAMRLAAHHDSLAWENRPTLRWLSIGE